jgi:hypothetical protein
MAVMLDQAQILHASMEKKAKQFDRIVGEWKTKVWKGAHEMDTWNFRHIYSGLNLLQCPPPHKNAKVA